MKKITLLITLLAFTFSFSQAIPVTFDSDIISGAKVDGVVSPSSANWFSDSGLTSASVEDVTATAPSQGNAGKIISSASGQPWQNAQILLQDNYIDLTSNKVITLDVWAESPQDFLLKMEQSLNGGPNTEKGFAHGGTGWETISVDFTTPNSGQEVPNDQYRLFVLFPCYSVAAGWDNGPFESTTYVDNFSGTVGDAIANPSAPTTAAPTPAAREAADVVSFFSDAYTDITFPETPTSWSQSGFETVNIASGDDIWKFDACNFFAMADYDGVDLSSMETMHIDYWTPDTTENAKIFVKLVDTVSGLEELIDLGLSVAGSWQSVEIDLSTFTTLTDLSNVTQVLYDPTADGSIQYIDNFYFYKAPASNGDAPTTAAPTPAAREAADVVSFFSDAYTDITFPETPTSWSQSGFETVNIASGDDIWKFDACNFFAMADYDGVDLSSMETMHIDYWTPDTTENAKIFVKLVDTVSGLEELIDLGLSVAGSWQSVEIDLSTFTTLTDLSNVTQVLYDPTADGSIQFIDNFYFYKEPTAGLEDNVFNTVKMFPNPAKDTVKFSVNSSEVLDIEIFDMLGKFVLGVNDVQNEVNISGLNSGLYFVQMTLGTQQATKKLVVN